VPVRDVVEVVDVVVLPVRRVAAARVVFEPVGDRVPVRGRAVVPPVDAVIAAVDAP